MSLHLKRTWKCDLCQHYWLAKTVDPPDQCPHCHKRNWHNGKDYTADAVPTPRESLPNPTPSTSSIAIDPSDSQEHPPSVQVSQRGYHALFRRQYGRNPKSPDELNLFISQRLTLNGQKTP